MKILWYTNTPCLYKHNNTYNGGGWLSSLQAMLMKREDVELGIAFFLEGEEEKVIEKRVTYYTLRFPKHSWKEKAQTFICSANTLIVNERKRIPLYEEIIRKPLEDFKPDVIMVFGSEMPFGLVAGITDIPVILHIQGILNPYLNAYLPPFVSWKEYKSIGNGWKNRLHKRIERKMWMVSCARETEICKRVMNYFGRTDWDYRVTQILHPGANYLFASEVLRPVFYQPMERALPDKLTIVTTISSPLYKGYDLVLKTAKMLSEKGVFFEWKCYGNINPSIVEKQLAIKHEKVNVSLCGVASAEQLCDAICHATVYVHTSYIDNSPNSLCEAQILGCTPIATYVGGVPSLIKNGETGYLVPANDPYQLAFLLEDLFLNPEKNLAIGKAAKEVAVVRHNPNQIVDKLLNDLQSLL